MLMFPMVKLFFVFTLLLSAAPTEGNVPVSDGQVAQEKPSSQVSWSRGNENLLKNLIGKYQMLTQVEKKLLKVLEYAAEMNDLAKRADAGEMLKRRDYKKLGQWKEIQRLTLDNPNADLADKLAAAMAQARGDDAASVTNTAPAPQPSWEQGNKNLLKNLRARKTYQNLTRVEKQQLEILEYGENMNKLAQKVANGGAHPFTDIKKLEQWAEIQRLTLDNQN
jgi:hypothetical protein